MNNTTDESTVVELKTQLSYAIINAEKSLQAEGIVGEKFKSQQKEMTIRLFQLVSSLRIRIAEKANETLSK